MSSPFEKWPIWSKSDEEQDWEAREDPSEFLPEADLEELADRGEDAYLRYICGVEGMDPSEAIA
jgi:hypothetical protein